VAGLASAAGLRGALNACFAPDRVEVTSASPLELRGPFARDGAPLFYLRNVTTGIFANDRYDIALRALPGATVQVASSSATKVHESLGATAQVATQLEALPGSRLVHGPHATILQAGSSLRQSTTCTVHQGASLVLAEVLSFGRLARGERLCFSHYESELVVQTPQGTLQYEERYSLTPDDSLEAALAGYGALACVYILGATIDSDALHQACQPFEYAGSSAVPNNAGYVVKGLASSLSAGLALVNAILTRL
jgi:urease accessory protein